MRRAGHGLSATSAPKCALRSATSTLSGFFFFFFFFFFCFVEGKSAVEHTYWARETRSSGTSQADESALRTKISESRTKNDAKDAEGHLRGVARP